MSVGAITASKADVSITCDNATLVAGSRDSAAAIQATAPNGAAAEDKLTAVLNVATAINANPYLRRPVDVRNPLRAAEERRRVELEDVPGLN